MAHELWTSPTTGYRRLGTKLSEVRALFESGITVRAILEPLKCCPIFAAAPEMKNLLDKRDFDVAGVKENENEPVIGYVKRSSLEHGEVRDHLLTFGPGTLISESTPLADLFKVFQDQEHIFVLTSTVVSGIVTKADLNKPPARIYLFGLVSLFEMHMSFWIRKEYGREGWQNSLSVGRLNQARELYEDRRRRNQEIDLFDCVQFADKKDLLLRCESLRQTLNIESRNKGDRLLRQAEKLRNSLAHSQQDLTEGSEWNSIIDAVEWIEKTLESSDAEIGKQAQTYANHFNEELW